MENVKKFQQTTSSSFYNVPQSPQSNQSFPIYQPMKPTFPELVEAIDNMNDRTQILKMQEDLNLIRRTMRKCQENIVKISQVEELKAMIEKMQEELVLAREKYLAQHQEVKQEIENMLAMLEKQLQAYRKEWERLRAKCAAQLEEQIQQVKTLKSLNQTHLTTLFKSTSSALRQNISTFTQQLKASKKNRNAKTNALFQHLQRVRNNLNTVITNEENKRNQYDQIIYGLLDRACDNAANALRRRVY